MSSRQKSNLSIKEITVFAMLGALLYASKVIMEVLPNIHFIASIIIAITVVYRKKALYPIYIFVLLTGLLNGFASWWVPYLYIWTVLWAVIMLLPKNISKKKGAIIYSVIGCLHGLLYGILYAPIQAILHGLDFRGMLAWIAAGFSFDILHGIGNFVCGLLIIPLIELLQRVEKIVKKS